MDEDEKGRTHAFRFDNLGNFGPGEKQAKPATTRYTLQINSCNKMDEMDRPEMERYAVAGRYVWDLCQFNDSSKCFGLAIRTSVCTKARNLQIQIQIRIQQEQWF